MTGSGVAMSQPRISVAIATYNRCRTLADTLESLTRQTVRPGAYELLLIDNNCTDETVSVIQSFAGRLDFRYLKETVQGLSHCRNRAIDEFTGDVLIFTDDDVLLEPDWLASYAEALTAYPLNGIFGGRVKPIYEYGRPGWLVDENLALINGLILNLDHGSELRPFVENEIGPFGASFAVRREIFDVAGHFRTDLGRVGKGLGRGEETDFINRSLAITCFSAFGSGVVR